MSNFLKEEKRNQLLNAANSLFLEKGVIATTISDIAARAKVAKGSFYLYFKDKNDIHMVLTAAISRRLMAEAYAYVEKNRTEDFTENVVLFADYLIQYFKREPNILKMLDRKFGWPAVRDAVLQEDFLQDPTLQGLMRDVQNSPVTRQRTPDQVRQLIYILVDMVGSCCYSSILHCSPAPIDEITPMLYEIIRKTLRD